MKVSLILAALLLSSVSYAQDIFVIKKNHNPKNELRYKANVDSCKFKTPGVTGYWLMGEEDGHTEGLTRTEKPIYEPRISYAKEDEVDFSIGAMDRMGSKLADKTIRVRMENCVPKAYLILAGREVLITQIYVQVKLISVDYMIIYGTAPDGSKVAHKIDI